MTRSATAFGSGVRVPASSADASPPYAAIRTLTSLSSVAAHSSSHSAPPCPRAAALNATARTTACGSRAAWRSGATARSSDDRASDHVAANRTAGSASDSAAAATPIHSGPLVRHNSRRTAVLTCASLSCCRRCTR